MKPLSARDPFKIGLVGLTGVVLLGLIVLVLSVVSFGTHSYKAVLENSAGLRAGESVEVHGVVSGKVKSVALSGKTVVVTFTLSKDISLGSESRASVKVATLLGTHYLEVDPQGDQPLADGEIPIGQTTVPYNLQDVLEQGTARLDALDPVELAKALTAVSKTFDAAGPQVGPALQGVARLSQLVTERSTQTGQLLQAAHSVTDQLSASSHDLVGLMKQTDLVVDEVTRRRAAIHRLLVETTSLSDALDAIVHRTDSDLGPALRNINAALDSLNSQDKSLQHVLDVMAPAMRYVANAAGSGPYVDLFADPPGLLADNVRCKTTGGC